MPSCSTPATLTVRPRKSATADCRCALAYVDTPEGEIEGAQPPIIAEEAAPEFVPTARELAARRPPLEPGDLEDQLVVGAQVVIHDPEGHYHADLHGKTGKITGFTRDKITLRFDGGGGVTLPKRFVRIVPDPNSLADIPESVYTRLIREDGVANPPANAADALLIAMRVWRGDFASSSNMRAILEGRDVAPAFKDDKKLFLYAHVIREALARARPLTRTALRIVPGEAPAVGEVIDMKAAAVGFDQAAVEEFRKGFLVGGEHPTLYHFPDGTPGLTFPDGQEGIVSGRFEVERVSTSPDRNGITDVYLKEASPAPQENPLLAPPGKPPVYEAHIGITPFRAGEDNIIGFYDTKKYEQFVNDMRVAADHYNVQVKGYDRVDGLWQGVQEPALQIHAVDGEVGVKAFAADLGKAYNQDGVLLFDPILPGEGPVHMAITFDPYTNRERIIAALGMQGIDGATILADGRLQVVGVGSDFLERAQRVAHLLGVDYQAEVGRMTLLDREAGDYEAAIKAAQPPEGLLGPDPAMALPGDNTISLEFDDNGHRPKGISELGGGHVNPVYKATVNGEDFIIKPAVEGQGKMRTNITPGNDHGRERAAYLFSRYIEAIDPNLAVQTPQLRIAKVTDDLGNKTDAVVSRFLNNAETAVAHSYDFEQDVSDEDLRNASLFDAIIGNTDRHGENFMFDPLGDIHLIDHGLAFPENNDHGLANTTLIREANNRWAEVVGPPDEYGGLIYHVLLTDPQKAMLTKMEQAWPQIKDELASLVGEDAMIATFKRISSMLDSGYLPDAYGDFVTASEQT